MSDFDDHQLKLALAYHLVDMVVTADGTVQAGEAAYMNVLFPVHLLAAEGFADDDGVLMTALDDAMKQAIRVMPDRMDLDSKLELLTMCLDASLSDESADEYELVHVRVAAKLLGVTDEQLDAHLASLPTVGELDLDDLVLDEEPFESLPPEDDITSSPPPVRNDR